MLRINDLKERVIIFLLNIFPSKMDFGSELSHSPGIQKFDVELEDSL